MDFLEILECENSCPIENSQSSQTSSYLPSPVISKPNRNIQSQSSSYPSLSSQASSPLPSPTITTLDKLLGPMESCRCDLDIDNLCSKLDQLNSDDRNMALTLLINKSEKSDLKNFNEETINHLSKEFGEYCRDEIKC